MHSGTHASRQGNHQDAEDLSTHGAGDVRLRGASLTTIGASEDAR